MRINRVALVQIAAIALALVLLIGVLLYLPLERIPSWGWDLAVFTAGSRALLNGDNPYLPGMVEQYAQGAQLATIPNFVYAPFFGILIAPLSVLPPGMVSRIWFVGNLVMYVAAFGLLLNAFGWRPRTREFLWLVIGLGVFPPFRTLVTLGQSAGLLLFLTALVYWLMVRGRHPAAGAALALTTFKPHLAMLPMLLAARRNWRALTAFAIAALAIALPFLGLLDDWLKALVDTRTLNLSFGCLPLSSLTAFASCFVDAPLPLTLVQVLITAAVVAILAVQPRPGGFDRRRLGYEFSLVISLSLLVFDNVRVADQVLLVFPMLFALSEARRSDVGRRRSGIIALLLMAYLSPYLAQIYGLVIGRPNLYGLPIWYAIVSLAACLAVLTARPRRISAVQPDPEGVHRL